MPLRRPQMTQDSICVSAGTRPAVAPIGRTNGVPRNSETWSDGGQTQRVCGDFTQQVQYQHPMCESLDTQRRRTIAQTTSFTSCAAPQQRHPVRLRRVMV
jgi:hypothetical protein